jgi:thiol-disulfide isomerase/thioredoxin
MMNTKTFSFALAIITLITFSCSNSDTSKADRRQNPNQFTISGNVGGLDTLKYMGIYFNDDNGIGHTDTIFVDNGSFKYVGEISNTQLVFFWPMYIERLSVIGSSKAGRFQAIVNPGDDIVFTGEVSHFIDAYPSGTPANDDLKKINQKVYPLLASSSVLNSKLWKMRLNSENESDLEGNTEFKALEDSVNVLNEQVLRDKIEFVKSNTKSQAAAWYLSDLLLRRQVTDKEAIEFFEQLDGESLKGFLFYDEVAARVKAIKEVVVGNEIENFTSVNVLNDEEFNLTDLRGKYVFIDFWGLWCGPCRREMPRVKEYQEKYKDKLVVVGVNNGDSKEKIVDFINKSEYSWIQLMDRGQGNNLVVKFNVQGFPTKLILDPEGKLAYRSLGSGDSTFEKLDELLSE